MEAGPGRLAKLAAANRALTRAALPATVARHAPSRHARPMTGPDADAPADAAAPGLRAAVRPALLQACVVLLGTGALGLVSSLLGGTPRAQPPALVAVFGALYLGLARWTRRRSGAAAPWKPGRLVVAGAALLAGAAIQAAPHLAVHGALVRDADWPRAFASLTAASLGLTVCAVSWEELWFRNPVLDGVPAGPPAAAFAVVNGLLFAALHLLNPRFDVLAEGPEILAAGVFLTLAYSVSGAFAVSLALHLGNNLTSALLRQAVDPARADALADASVSHWRAGILLAASAALAWRSCVLARRPPASPGAVSS